MFDPPTTLKSDYEDNSNRHNRNHRYPLHLHLSSLTCAYTWTFHFQRETKLVLSKFRFDISDFALRLLPCTKRESCELTKKERPMRLSTSPPFSGGLSRAPDLGRIYYCRPNSMSECKDQTARCRSAYSSSTSCAYALPQMKVCQHVYK